MSKPSVGRVVHYVSYGTPGGEYQSQCRAAIITDVPDLLNEDGPNIGPEGYVKAVSLCVLNPTGQFFNTEIKYSEDHEGGTWHWPERVE